MAQATSRLLISTALIWLWPAITTQAAEFGTAEEAKAMLARAVTAVKNDEPKALAMFNNGASGFKDRDLYVLCANASDGTITASPHNNGSKLTAFSPGQTGDADGDRGKSARNNLLVASSWLHQATQEAYLLYKSRGSNLRCGLLGGIGNYSLDPGIKEQLSLEKEQRPNIRVAALRGGEVERSTKPDVRDMRLEDARKELVLALNGLRSSGKLTAKEADAVEAAIEDELIALRVGPVLSKRAS